MQFNKLIQKLIFLIIAIISQVNAVNAKDELIKVRDINEVPLDEIGVLDGNNGGLKKHIWYESNRAFMESMLVSMPVNDDSDVTKKLSNLLLLSTATPPRSDKSLVSSVFIIKIKKMALMGQYQNVSRMISQVPQTRLTEEMHQISVASFFMDNQYIKGCDEVTKYLRRYPSVFWSKLRVICNAYHEKQTNVDFDIKLLKEQGHELPEDYLKVTKLFEKGEKDKAKEHWYKILKKEVLFLPDIQNSLPDTEYVLRSILGKQELIKWIEDNKDRTDIERLNQTSFLFANIDALGTQVSLDTWRQFIMFAMSKDLVMPDYAAYRLLKQTPSDGERILTIIHILANTDITKIPEYLFTQIIYSMNRMGFKKESVKLAQQRLF